jgi:hypothetical protein
MPRPAPVHPSATGVTLARHFFITILSHLSLFEAQPDN